MRLERAIISLAPRTTSNCLDLALVFLRQYLRPILMFWLIVALPTCGLVYWLVDDGTADWRAAWLAFFMASSPLGVLVIAGAAPCAFGEEFTLRETMRRLGLRSTWLFIKCLLVRCAILIGCFIVVLPGCWIMVRYGFLVEKSVLQYLSRNLHDRRTNDLIKGEMGDLFVRGGWIAIFTLLLWVVVFLCIDISSNVLFGFPLCLGRAATEADYLGTSEDAQRYMMSYLSSDPLVVSTLLAAALLVYPLGRLAWFFCYVDLRVRRDCWDLELNIAEEARRLEEPA